jgi:hypothetical protein
LLSDVRFVNNPELQGPRHREPSRDPRRRIIHLEVDLNGEPREFQIDTPRLQAFFVDVEAGPGAFVFFELLIEILVLIS